jgi:hypothetical protein
MNTISLKSLLLQINQIRHARGLGQLVMLRNFEGLPENKPGNDIDLIVRTQELHAWCSVMETAALAMDVKVKPTMSDYYFCSFVFSSGDNEIVKIDLNHKLLWRGVTFMEMEKILGNTELYRKPIYVCASAADRIFVTFCHSFLYGGFINPKYLKEFADQLRDGPEFRVHLIRTFGTRYSGRLTDLILSNNIAISRWEANKIRIAALIRSVARTPIRTLRGFIKSFGCAQGIF